MQCSSKLLTLFNSGFYRWPYNKVSGTIPWFLRSYLNIVCSSQTKSQEEILWIILWGFFWPVFYHIRTEYGEIRIIFPYSIQMRENTDQKNYEYGHFSRSVDAPVFKLQVSRCVFTLIEAFLGMETLVSECSNFN